ncbi:MAG TPA: DUF805 domain-containing protein [Anaerolineales bacterium]|nr:DUF805 domain-containing protein [Anaerolineales bacterium]
MSWYLAVLKKYADFSGRARRKEYWMFLLFNAIFFIGAEIIEIVLLRTRLELVYRIIYIIIFLWYLAILVPAMAVLVRRLHDIGRSGRWFFIGLIPLIGVIWLIVLLATGSQPGKNQYGPNPKRESKKFKLSAGHSNPRLST